MLRHVTVLYHPRRRAAIEEAERLCAELDRRNIVTTLGNGWDPDTLDAIGDGVDLAVVLGGDGTIMQVARSSAPSRVSVLGVNLGRIGFLAELTPKGLHDRLDAVVRGAFWVEERLMLDVQWRSAGRTEGFLSLNEVAVSRGAEFQAVNVAATIDDVYFTSYTADGVLVVTPTGSTAYSLAAGGPVLYPESEDFLITPVAPHLHIGRSTIVSGETQVVLELTSELPAVMSVDGVDTRELQPQDQVEVRRSAFDARFARLGPRSYFYAALSDQLHWS